MRLANKTIKEKNENQTLSLVLKAKGKMEESEDIMIE